MRIYNSELPNVQILLVQPLLKQIVNIPPTLFSFCTSYKSVNMDLHVLDVLYITYITLMKPLLERDTKQMPRSLVNQLH